MKNMSKATGSLKKPQQTDTTCSCKHNMQSSHKKEIQNCLIFLAKRFTKFCQCAISARSLLPRKMNQISRVFLQSCSNACSSKDLTFRQTTTSPGRTTCSWKPVRCTVAFQEETRPAYTSLTLSNGCFRVPSVMIADKLRSNLLHASIPVKKPKPSAAPLYSA